MPVNTMPTDREGLILWLCENPDHVDEYIQANGGGFLSYAKARTAQVFGIQYDFLGEEIGNAAMELLFERARTERLLEISVPVENWLYGVIKVLVKASFREHAEGTATHLNVDDPALQEELSHVSYALPPDSAEMRRLSTSVEDCMKRLTPRQRQILTMRLHDPDHIPENGDIAASLGISTGNVAVHLFQARQSMQDCLQKKGLP